MSDEPPRDVEEGGPARPSQPPERPASIPAPATVPRPLSKPPPAPPADDPAARDLEPPTGRRRLDTLNPPASVPPPAPGAAAEAEPAKPPPVVVPPPRQTVPGRSGHDLDGTTADYDPSSFDDGSSSFDDAPTVDYDPRNYDPRARGVFTASGSDAHVPAAAPSRPTPPPAPPDLDLGSTPDSSPSAEVATTVHIPTPPPSARARRRTSRRTVRIPNDPIARAAAPPQEAALAARQLEAQRAPAPDELGPEEIETIEPDADTPATGVRAVAGTPPDAGANGEATSHAGSPAAPQPALADLADEIEHEPETIIKPMRIVSIGEASPPPPSSPGPEDITDEVEAMLAAEHGDVAIEDRESFSEIEEIEPDRMSDVPDAPRKVPPPPPPKARPDPSRVAQLPPPTAHATPSPVTPPPEPDRPRTKSWWEELFTDDFIRTLDRPQRKHVTREVNFIEESLGVQQGAVILDLACGSGEHAVELASRGYSVVGYDLSLAMLARAADEAQERNQKINFLQGDMREMAFEEMFDGIYCWSTSFGYFDDERNYSVLQRIHRALRVGGMFLLDMVNRDYVAPRSPSLVWFEGDGCVCMDDMHVDFFTSRLRVKRTTMFDDGRSKEIDYAIRLYTLHELGKMLHECGFKVVEVTGHPAHPGIFFGSESPRMIVLAEKSG